MEMENKGRVQVALPVVEQKKIIKKYKKKTEKVTEFKFHRKENFFLHLLTKLAGAYRNRERNPSSE